MPLSPEEVYARVVEQVGEGGRLPMPPVHEWDIFPWEQVGDTWLPKVVGHPLAAEAPRWGEGAKRCECGVSADSPDQRNFLPRNTVWHNERWAVSSMDEPGGLPLILFLHPREHLDLGDLDDEMAAEYGRVSIWLHRIMSRLPHIGRVHVCRWGDGGSHLHVWFLARYERLPNILGSMLAEWNEMLPPPPADVWRADIKHVADRLAHHDGTSLV
jgi:hypothetical protein